MISQTILCIGANAVRIFLYFYFFHLFYEKLRISKLWVVLYGILYFIVNSAIFLNFNSPPLNTANNLIFLYGATLFYRGNWQRKLFLPIGIFIVSGLTEGIATLLPILDADQIADMQIGTSMAIGVFLFYLFILLVKGIFRHDKYLPFRYWLMMIAVPLLSLFAIIALVYRYTITPTQLLCVYIALIGINILIFWLYDRISSYFLLQQEVQTLKYQTDSYENILSLQQKAEDQIHGLHHELKHHLVLIHAYLQSDQSLSAMEYIESITSEIDHVLDFKICNNPTINSIIDLKIKETKEKGIDFGYRVDIPEECPINESDLCVLLFNMLDNAIEAQEYVSKEREKYIFLHIYISNDAWIFRIENSCRDDLHLKNDEYPKSNKTGFPYHGYGIRNINHIANCYNGQHDCMVRKSVFYETVMLLDPILN